MCVCHFSANGCYQHGRCPTVSRRSQKISGMYFVELPHHIFEQSVWIEQLLSTAEDIFVQIKFQSAVISANNDNNTNSN